MTKYEAHFTPEAWARGQATEVDPEGLTCRECGEDVWISDAGTAHHWGAGMDDIDHDADADHVALPEPEVE